MSQQSGRDGHYESISIGCLPKHAAEMNERLKKHGVAGAHFDAQTGILHMESRTARQQCTKLFGAIDEGN